MTDRAKLINKNYKQYDKISRYTNFPYYYNESDSKYQYGTTAWLKNSTSFIKYKIQDEDTLDTLALKNYNNPTYFWVIADFNRITDPYKKLTPGEYLNIPVFSTIEY